MSAERALVELFELWPAYREVAEYVSRDDPRAADPHSIYGAACACEHDRLVARLYGAHIGESLEDSERILDEVLSMAREGKRPRCGRELGLTPEMFGGQS